MSDTEHLLMELYALAQAQCEGTLDDERHARLDALILGDRALCCRYVLYMQAHAAAEQDLADCSQGKALPTHATRDFLDNPLQSKDETPGITSLLPAPIAPPTAMPSVGFLGHFLNFGGGTPGAVVLTWLVVALCTCMMLGVIVLAIRGIQVHVDGQNVAKVPANATRPLAGKGQGARAALAVSPVARLNRMADCVWADEATAPRLNDVLVIGRKLQIKSGLAEIVFQNGAKVLLQGPVDFSVRSGTSGHLHRGKLTAIVEGRSARGFAIHTPGMKYTDLGTEFGVLVADDGAQVVDVFRGTVRAEEVVVGDRWSLPSGEQPAPLPPAVAAGPEGNRGERVTGNGRINDESSSASTDHSASLVLKANEAIRVEKRQGHATVTIVRQAAKPSEFVRSEQFSARLVAEQSPEFRRWKTFRDELCKRSDLVAYYDFQPDESDSTALRNRAALGRQFDGRLVGGAEWVEGRLPGKKALSFSQPGSGVRIDIPLDFKQITLLAWAKLDPLPHERVRAYLNSDTWTERAGSVHWQGRPNGIDISLDRGVTNLEPALNATAPTDAIGQWDMIAETYDATTREHYRYSNGILVDKRPAHKSVAARIGRAMIGTFNPQTPSREVAHLERTLNGRIDELMIFSTALSGQEVRRVFQAGQPPKQ